MAANLRSCWKCMHNFAASKQLFSLQIKCFSSSSVLERLKNDYRIKPAPPKRKWEPPVIRQDVIFLYKGVAKRSFPYHKFDLAMEILRAIAVKDENVNLFIRLNLKGKDVRLWSIFRMTLKSIYSPKQNTHTHHTTIQCNIS